MSNTNPRVGCLLLGMAVLLCAGSAEAYRPFDGTDADTAEPGEFELELGPVQYYQEGKSKYLITPATVLNLGLFPRWEINSDFNTVIPLHPTDEASPQLLDTSVALKTVLRRGVLQDETGPSVALEFGAILPEVNGETGFGASTDLIVSEQWSWLTLHLNNELSLSRKDLYFTWFAGLIAEGRFGGPVRPVMELSWEREFPTKSSVYSALVGAIWSVHEALDLDAAVRVASIDEELAFEARLGLTWAFAIWKSGDEKPEHGEPEPGR